MYPQKMFRWILVLTIVSLYAGCLPLSPAGDDDTDDEKRCENIFERYPESDCLLFDDEHCDDEDWVRAFSNGTQWSAGSSIKFSNDGESVSVREGCTLTVYKEWNWAGEKYKFVANGTDLHVTLDTVEGSLLDSFDDAINALKCTCQ